MVSTRSGVVTATRPNAGTRAGANILPPKKRQRTTKPLVAPNEEERGDPGSLHSFSNVPVETFSEVLMSNGAKAVWKAACWNTPGIPERPPDMTEPEFAYFLYGKDCFYDLSTVSVGLVFGFDRLPKRRNYRPLVEECYAEWRELQQGNSLEYAPDYQERATCPSKDDFFDLPGVEPIFAVGAEPVPLKMWEDVKEQGRALFLSTREEALAQLLAVLNIDREPPPEDRRAREAKIQETITLLSRKPFLVTALLASLGLDEATFNGSVEDRRSPYLVCMRCDEHVAECKDFPNLLRHYYSTQVWYDRVTTLVNSNPKKAYHKRRDRPFEPPVIVNSHDWSTGEPLVRICTFGQSQELQQQQRAFDAECRKDPDDDKLGEGGEDFAKNWENRRVLRSCKLCPVGFSPKPQQRTRFRDGHELTL
ncbi:hypothetical protein FRB99_007828 [Tulasnella sp. 403]|nr:hypothetical protein FRB99_007828 [Tulasnella sp. 403]